MTKAERILQLYDGARTTRQIAEIIHGGPVTDKEMAYVRVVLRQRFGTRRSDTDRRYHMSSLGRTTRRKRFKERYDSEPAFRERHLLFCARRYCARKAEARQ
jgi:hypothetical protein